MSSLSFSNIINLSEQEEGHQDITIPFELIDNRIFFDVYINNSGPYKFILDSGGSNLISKRVSEQLQIKLSGEFKINGAGDNSQTAFRTMRDHLSISELNLEKQNFIVIDLDTIMYGIGFEELDGLLGYELFNNYLVTINYDKNIIVLSKNYDDFINSSNKIPLSFWGNKPLINLNVDNIDGQYMIDTGDRSSITFFNPFIDSLNLREKYKSSIINNTGYGIGGPIPAQVSVVKNLFINNIIINNLIVRLPNLNGGLFSLSGFSGSIGNGVLKKFNITFDYKDEFLILEKNSNYYLDESYDKSGMWLAKNKDRFIVTSLVTNGPAAKAGLKLNDVIISINGINTTNLNLIKIRNELSYLTSGSLIKIIVIRSGGKKSITIKLEKLL